MTTSRPAIEWPTFLCIGGQRCGSTYLNKILDSHSQIQMAPKERQFFNHRIYEEGLDWYLSYFYHEQVQNVAARGEISPNYAVMRRPEIRLTKELFPDLRIILIVRHPVDRMWSALRRHWTYSHLPGVSCIGQELDAMLSFADQRLHDAFGDYVTIWNNWTSEFGADHIKLIRFDDLKNQSTQTLGEILDFIGVEHSTWAPQDGPVPNRSKIDIEMPEFFRYYLSRRYLSRTQRFNRQTNGLVDDWVKDMEICVGQAPVRWRVRYYTRAAYCYYPVQLMHAIGDPVRFRWKTYGARRELGLH